MANDIAITIFAVVFKKKKEIEKGCDVFFFFGYYVPFNLGLAIFRIKVL